jgi:glutamate-1-semialdehyde 2,1-aminomutase
VAEAVTSGTSFGAPTDREVQLAAEIAERVPSVQMIRMTSSGTEATMSALRVARAATSREKVLKFSGAYHGHVDGLLAQAGSGLATQALPASPGVPEATTQDTIVVRWNDPDAVIEATERHALAAILAEPVPANMGVVPPEPGFLELLRARADATGALLIFDEVVTGFRVAPGGVQELTGVLPDVTIMGKVLGGGLPAAAFGGPPALMELLAPDGDVYQAGTLSGNPIAVAAGRETLRLLDDRAYLKLERITDALAQGLREAAADAGCQVQVQALAGLLTVFFTRTPVTDYAGACASDLAAFATFARALLDRGVYPPPSQFEAWFPSLVHTQDHVERTIRASREAFAEVAAR